MSETLADIFIFTVFLLPLALLLYCMLGSAEARGAIGRLNFHPGAAFRRVFDTPGNVRGQTRVGTGRSSARFSTGPASEPLARSRGVSTTQWRAFSTRKFSPHTERVNVEREMFKREVDRHAGMQKQTDLKKLFSSSPPASAAGALRNGNAKPLSSGTGNMIKASVNGSLGVKRTATGLAKALPAYQGFEEPGYGGMNSRHNPAFVESPKRAPTVSTQGSIFFDENDFDSDVDLEVEEKTAAGQIKYPELQAQKKVSTGMTHLSPTRSRQLPHPGSNAQASFDQSLPPNHTPGKLRSTPNENLLPWSSSPLDRSKSGEIVSAPVWSEYAYGSGSMGPNVQTAREVRAENARPVKRRTLPWLQSQAEEVSTYSSMSLGNTKGGKRGLSTPMGKNNTGYELPWNTSASAIKEQQKQLRQANKKSVKNNDATEADKTAAVEKKKTNQVHKVFLSAEQKHVLSLVVDDKKSVFFTGSAGTGKSVLLREIIAALRRKYLREPDRIAITASTGLAACNVGGVTLHSFAGIGLGKEDVQTLVRKIRRNQKAKHRWMRTKILIVDEVSMVDGELFDKLEEIARTLRNNGRPFGGIQLVITGDFFQLPPVPEGGRAARFAFDAATWNTCIEHTIALHQVFRQKDPEFASMLNEMREGRLSERSIARFRSLNREVKFDDMIDATELFPTRFEVDNANATRMRHLQGDSLVFESRDGGTVVDKVMRDRLLANCMAPESIELKKGAQVMLIKNIDETLVNGSLGKVIGFMSETMFDNYQQHEEEYYATQDAEAASGNPIGPHELSERKMKMKEMNFATTTQLYPVVRFAIPDGSTRDLLCQRESWKVELPNGEVQASRSQIPLILAWALSIHKAQGQTLERVKVDLGKVFEKGQAYVALSRATSMKGLQIKNFNANKVMAHDRVRDFYASLTRHEAEAEAGDAVSEGTKVRKAEGARRASEYEKEFTGDRYLDEDFDWQD